jgi:thiol-disulfide isomerase/thioredoxin
MLAETMRTTFLALTALSTLGLASCATAQAEQPAVCLNLPAGDYCAYDATRDAAEDIRIAQEIAAEGDLKSLIVFGANWCHDSRALAGHLREERFTPLLARHYRLVYVDVAEKNRNIDLAQSFGLPGIVGTPTVIIADSDGTVLNLDTAPTWRNAASRTQDEIYDYLERFAEME